jgi:TetR/AcrR family transcriptional regulator, transcriptional repressor for nem operon
VRYPTDQKAKAKEAILQAGAKALRTNGFNGIGVDGLASTAGVTSGAFYSNFSNKEDLLKEVIDAFLGNPFIDVDTGSTAERQERLKDYLKMYISIGHRSDPANGCVMPTLSADVARSSDAVREAYERKMTALIKKMSSVMEGSSAERESKAWTVLIIMIGAVSISRALPADKNSEKVLKTALKAALAIVK